MYCREPSPEPPKMRLGKCLPKPVVHQGSGAGYVVIAPSWPWCQFGRRRLRRRSESASSQCLRRANSGTATKSKSDIDLLGQSLDKASTATTPLENSLKGVGDASSGASAPVSALYDTGEQPTSRLIHVGHAEKWDELTIDGDVMAKDCLLRYKRNGRVLAVASIYRDVESLEAELAMERDAALASNSLVPNR
jgi:hypothetical protein